MANIDIREIYFPWARAKVLVDEKDVNLLNEISILQNVSRILAHQSSIRSDTAQYFIKKSALRPNTTLEVVLSPTGNKYVYQIVGVG